MQKSKNSTKIDRRIKEYIIYELQTFYENKRQLEEYKRDIIEGRDYTISDMSRGGTTSDNTYMRAEKLCSSTYIQNTERVINSIEKVLENIDACRYRAVEMLYLKQTHTVIGISIELHASESAVYNWVNSVVKMIGKELGLLN